MTPLRWALCLSLSIALCFALLRPSDSGGVIAGLEGRLLDARFLLRGSLPAPERVAILGIDDAALAEANAFPLPRNVIAGALETAADQGAAVVALDLLLAGQAPGDADLAEALGQDLATVLAISFSGPLAGAQPTSLETAPLETALSRSALSLVLNAPPEPPLSGLGPAPGLLDTAWIGHVNVARDADGALRRVPLLVQPRPGLVLPVLPLQAVRRASGEALTARWGQELTLGARALPVDRHNEAMVNFLGPTGTVPTISLHQAAEADLAGRILFIGATASGYGDRFATPFSREMPGVEVLAHLAANLLDGQLLRRDDLTWGVDVILAGVVAILGALTAALSVPLLAGLATAALWGAALGLLHGAFLQQIWLDGTTLLMALTVASLSGAVARFLVQRRTATNLARYQSPVLEAVLSQESRPRFDGRQQHAAVLFVDVADYTHRTEALDLAATTAFLRRFHNAVERAATAHAGLVEQFAGDGAMICFGLPEPTPEDPARALACAEALFDAVTQMNAALTAERQPPVRIRIGIHAGQATAAIVGGQRQGHVTFVGDVVNTASRLQDVAKSLSAELVVSADLVRAAGDVSAHRLVPAGPVTLRGRQAPIDIWIRPRAALDPAESPSNTEKAGDD